FSGFDEEEFLNLLCTSVEARIDTFKPLVLFHSAGKDSNAIALALSKRSRYSVTLACHSSSSRFDESDCSRMIARKLGFDHITLREPTSGMVEWTLYHDYFRSIPFPC